jgi:predicted MPP superfamily phosphohydrolase
MLDLETLDTSINPVIIRIAAISFDIKTGKMFDEIDIAVNAKSCIDKNLKISSSTISWWLQQNVNVIQEILIPSFISGTSIRDALKQFSDWINNLRKYNKTIYIWGNGISADNMWLQSAFNACNLNVPWSYYENMDLRTALLIKQKNYDIPFIGHKHNPIDDCKHQIKKLTL